MVRIKDIAREAKVSEGTVDRVLHNRGGVSKKTEEKIRHILEQRNFSINPVASALAMKHNHTIAVLIPEYTVVDSFWKLPHLGLLKASEDVKNLGIQVRYFKFNQYSASSYLQMFNELIKTNPTAVVLVPMFIKETNTIVKTLKKNNTTYVFLNVDIEGVEGSAFIGQDAYMSGFIAGKLMMLSMPLNANCGIIKTSINTGDNQAIAKRIEGFKHYFKENHAHPILHELKVESFSDPLNLASSIHGFLEQCTSIKALFIPSSRISAVVNILTKEQKASLKLIGFDNTPENVTCLKNNEILFLISQKPFDQGYEAVRILSDFLVKNKKINEKIYLPIDILTKENVDYNDANQLMFENNLNIISK